MEKIKTIKDISRLIRDTRKNQGLTQEQLAAACGIGIRFLRELEHGKESCHMGKAMTVLQMLGLELLIYPRGAIIS